METHVGQTFLRQTVEMDGEAFDRCTFRDCTFLFRGTAEFAITNCAITNCNWTFADAAALTVAVLGSLYRGGFTDLIDRTFDNIRTGAELKQGGSGNTFDA